MQYVKKNRWWEYRDFSIRDDIARERNLRKKRNLLMEWQRERRRNPHQNRSSEA